MPTLCLADTFWWLAADNLIGEPTTLGIATLSIATSKASSRDNLLCTGHSYNDSGSTSFVAVYFKVPPTLPSFEWMGHLLIFPTRMYILCYWLFACRWPPLPTGDHGQNLMCPPEGETAQINMLQHFVKAVTATVCYVFCCLSRNSPSIHRIYVMIISNIFYAIAMWTQNR